MNSDIIFIQGLEFYGYHGATDAEQTIGHRYQVDVRLLSDAHAASQSDALKDTTDYARAAQILLEIGTQTQYRLLEALADNMIQALFHQFPKIEQVSLRLQKRLPPMNAIVDAVGVEITRNRPPVS